jgi:hypothetical protein
MQISSAARGDSYIEGALFGFFPGDVQHSPRAEEFKGSSVESGRLGAGEDGLDPLVAREDGEQVEESGCRCDVVDDS